MAAFRAAVILAAFLLLTVILMPLQWLLVRGHLPGRRALPHAYHRLVARLFGIHIRIKGTPVRGEGVLLLANHTGWLDIVIFSAVLPVSFVAKSEVGQWPFFGTLARLQRTVFVARAERGKVGQTRDEIGMRLAAGEALVLFPEGTSCDGNRVLPFKSALLGAAKVDDQVKLQPVSAAYVGLHGVPMGRENRPLFAWYGDMELVPHLWEALKAGPLDVAMEFHPPFSLAQMDRKEAARTAERLVRGGQARAVAGNA
jgi:1-acyl-sn-glycerol-3-phosphate acyltransferase